MAKANGLKTQIIELYLRVEAASKRRPVYTNHGSNDMFFKNQDTGAEELALEQAIAILDIKLFRGLSPHACKLLIRIMEEMKVNNVFWLAGTTDAHIRRSIAELKRHGILIPTEQTGLFIINPFKLRRGKPLSSLMASLAYTDQGDIVLLEDLRPPKQALIQ